MLIWELIKQNFRRIQNREKARDDWGTLYMHAAYSGEHVNRNKHLLQFGPSFPHVKRQDLFM